MATRSGASLTLHPPTTPLGKILGHSSMLIYSGACIFHSLQFQSFVQFRGKLKSRSTDEIQQLKENPKAWNIHSMLNVLYSLVEKSNINKQVLYI